jgi:hypothetical protein
MDSDTPPGCCFCGGDQIVPTHRGLFPMKRPRPVVFYRCRNCGSGLTLPPPSADSPPACTSLFRSGLPELHREITATPANPPCTVCASAGARRWAAPYDRFTWMDVGAGGGILREMAKRFQIRGHGRRSAQPRARWMRIPGAWVQCDLNGRAAVWVREPTQCWPFPYGSTSSSRINSSAT